VALVGAVNSTINERAVELDPEEARGCLEDVVGLL
jgi:hypothetical protein